MSINNMHKGDDDEDEDDDDDDDDGDDNNNNNNEWSVVKWSEGLSNRVKGKR